MIDKLERAIMQIQPGLQNKTACRKSLVQGSMLAKTPTYCLWLVCPTQDTILENSTWRQ